MSQNTREGRPIRSSSAHPEEIIVYVRRNRNFSAMRFRQFFHQTEQCLGCGSRLWFGLDGSEFSDDFVVYRNLHASSEVSSDSTDECR